MIKILCVSMFLYFSISAIAQEKDSIIQGQGYNCYKIANGPVSFNSLTDSLINIASKICVIEEREGGDFEYTVKYQMFYFKDTTLQCMSTNNYRNVNKQEMLNVSRIIDDTSVYNIGKYFVYIDANAGTGNMHYNYFFVLDGKIAQSIFSNVPIKMILDEKIKKEIKLFHMIF